MNDSFAECVIQFQILFGTSRGKVELVEMVKLQNNVNIFMPQLTTDDTDLKRAEQLAFAG